MSTFESTYLHMSLQNCRSYSQINPLGYANQYFIKDVQVSSGNKLA